MLQQETKDQTIYMYIDDIYVHVSQIVQDSLFSLKKYSVYKYIIRVNCDPNKSTVPMCSITDV